MPISSHRSITSLEALNSTIKVDRQTCRWFLYLIRQKDVEERLSVQAPLRRSYQKLKGLECLERGLAVVLFAFLASVFLTGRFPLFYCGLLALPVEGLLHARRAKYVSTIAGDMLSQDFEPFDLAHKTLYQISEFYGKKYRTISLVDALFFSNKVLRSALIFSFIFFCLIYPLDFGYSCLALAAIFFFLYKALHTSILYRRIP